MNDELPSGHQRTNIGLGFMAALVALLIYLPFRSASLDDFDSYNFARALTEFSPAKFQPHPPGYVLYIWLGRAVLAFTGDARVALTTLSALSAALACGLLVFMGCLLWNRRVALIALILALFTPLMWLNADKALSDAPGLCAQAACALLLALSLRRRWPLWLPGASIGVAAGFRPQAMLGLCVAWVALALWQKANWRAWLAGGLAAVLGALTWLLPTLAALGWNVLALLSYLTGAAGFVTAQESLFATALTPQSVVARLQSVWEWGSRAVFGPQPEWLLIVFTLGALALTCLGIWPISHLSPQPLLRLRCTQRAQDVTPLRGEGERSPLSCYYGRGVGGEGLGAEGLLTLSWLIPQLALQVLFLNPELTRYWLNSLFPAALLVAAGLDRAAYSWLGWGKPALRRTIVTSVPVLLALGVGAWIGASSLRLAQVLHTVPAPPDQLAAYLAQHMDREQTFVLARQSYNALAYHLPGWQVVFADAYDPGALSALMAHSQSPTVVIADPEALQPDEQYAQVQVLRFSRDPQVHAKHALVEANVYQLLSSLHETDFALPADGMVQIGSPEDGKYILDGWYRREAVGGVMARWTGSAQTASLRVLLPARALTLTLRALSFVADQQVTVTCEDQPVRQVAVSQQWSVVSIGLPASCAQERKPTHITLGFALRRAPSDDGTSTDHRVLAIAVSELSIR